MKQRSLEQEQQAASGGTQAQEEAWAMILWLTINTEQHMEPLGTGFFKIIQLGWMYQEKGCVGLHLCAIVLCT